MSAPTLASAAARTILPIETLTTRRLKVGGITPFTATDYPGKLAAVVFVQGCPWRCGYCHNPHLQSRTEGSPLDWEQVLVLLRRRVGLIDAVVFSGGEPTMDAGLEDAMRGVRAMGFGVGLHTAGMYPRRLQAVLPLVDWVGLDIKATPQAYDTITRVTDSAQVVWASAATVLASGVAHEFRTTVHPDLHTEQDLLALAQTLKTMGVRNYALQIFRNTGCQDDALAITPSTAYPSADLTANVSALFERFVLRRE